MRIYKIFESVDVTSSSAISNWLHIVLHISMQSANAPNLDLKVQTSTESGTRLLLREQSAAIGLNEQPWRRLFKARLHRWASPCWPVRVAKARARLLIRARARRSYSTWAVRCSIRPYIHKLLPHMKQLELLYRSCHKNSSTSATSTKTCKRHSYCS